MLNGSTAVCAARTFTSVGKAIQSKAGSARAVVTARVVKTVLVRSALGGWLSTLIDVCKHTLDENVLNDT